MDGIVEKGETVRHLGVLCDVGRALTSTLEQERLLPVIARRVGEAVRTAGLDLYECRPGVGSVLVASWTSAGHGNGAGYPDHGEAAGRLPTKADEALYLAGGLGKNRVEVYR